MNADNITTIRDLSKLAHQSHLKALIINSRTSEVVDWFEFENNFKFSELLDNTVEMIGRTPVGDFQKAIEEFTSLYSVEDLLKA